MIRSFILKNEYGQQYPLNDPRTGFMQNPTGLGNAKEFSFVAIGSAWMANYVRNAQPMIGCEIVFAGPNPYNTYADLARFIRASKKLTLVYTTSYGTFYKDVAVVTYEKTELTSGGVLVCPTTFAATSLWYSPVSSNITINSGDLLYIPFTLPARFNDSTFGNIPVTIDGSEPAPFRVKLHGPIATPSIVLSVGGSELYRADIDYSASSGESINYSSVDDDLYCYHETAAGVKTNLISYMDIENANFFKLPVGSSTLKITSTGSLTAPVIINVYNLYGAV